MGKIGLAINKKEGDGKTPIGVFDFGIAFGTHEISELKFPSSIKYYKINPYLYWIDDKNSKYYNKLINILEVVKDWHSAEHLEDYPIEYEYAIEIKANEKNLPGKRKCDIFTLL